MSTCCRSKTKQTKKPGGGNRVAEMAEAVEVLRLNMLSGQIASVESKPSSTEAEAVEENRRQSNVSLGLAVLEQASSSPPPGSLNKVDSPEFVSLECDGRRIEFEADCGACRSVISVDTCRKFFPNRKLKGTSLEFVSVSGQRIKP